VILKGNQRKGGADLAAHLLNAHDNERVELAEVKGTIAQDLAGAFAEYEALAAGTRCREPLYSLSINPSSPLTRAQYGAAINLIEERLGLKGQPRAVVFHVKHGREHCHIVWSRVDTRRMTAIQLSHDKMKLRRAARDIARQFGLDLPPGLAEDRGEDRFDEPPDMTPAEKAAAEATGITPAQRRAEITQAWRRAADPQAFRKALATYGYVLARGDKRGFVVVDRYGHVHSLSRQIDGARTRDIGEKLRPLASADLPSVEQARDQQRRAADDQNRRRSAAIEKTAEKLRASLARTQAERRTAYEHEWQALKIRHAGERLSLRAGHHAENQTIARRRAARKPRGFVGGLRRVFRIEALVKFYWHRQDTRRARRHARERAALRHRHDIENLLLQRRFEALKRLARREKRSLDIEIMRLYRIAERQAARATEERLAQIRLNAAQMTRDTMADLKTNAGDITGRRKSGGRAAGRVIAPAPPRGLSLDL